VLEFEVTDSVEARRAKTAQYNGVVKTLQLGGQTVAGVVTSVLEDRSQSLPRWLVRVRLAAERTSFQKAPIKVLRKSRVVIARS
jgi:hypothetical protein